MPFCSHLRFLLLSALLSHVFAAQGAQLNSREDAFGQTQTWQLEVQAGSSAFIRTQGSNSRRRIAQRSAKKSDEVRTSSAAFIEASTLRPHNVSKKVLNATKLPPSQGQAGVITLPAVDMDRVFSHEDVIKKRPWLFTRNSGGLHLAPAYLFQLDGADVPYSLSPSLSFIGAIRHIANLLADEIIVIDKRRVSLTRLFVESESNSGSKALLWLVFYVVTVVALWYLVRRKTHSMAVDLGTDPSQEIASLKGSPCCVLFINILVVVVTCVVFISTMLTVAATNARIEKNPAYNGTMNGVNVTVTQFPIKDPGQRAYLAGLGVVLSLAMASLVLLNWRTDGPVLINTDLLARYAFRGGTISVLVALIMENIGSAVASKSTVGGIAASAVSMLIVGFSEELCKITAVTCCTCIKRRDIPEMAASHCCASCCMTLVETPKCLILAGMAAGFGFMIAENIGYISMATLQPPLVVKMSNHTNTTMSKESPDEITFTAGFLIAARVLLNVHPWLTGISAAQVARLGFKVGRPSACLFVSEMAVCILPSALIHASYDFALSIMPDLVGLMLVPVFWYCSRYYYSSLWDASCEDEFTVSAPG